MKRKTHLKKRALAVLSYLSAFLLLSLFLFPSSPFADTSLCARVKIEIDQKLTLERQAFDAHMAINNGLTNITLENIGIVVKFSDKDGNSVLASSDPNNTQALFFIRLDTMSGISDINGAGTVAPSSTADIHWLIIPAPGTSNGLDQGTLYYVGASLQYTIGGQQNAIDVSPDYIYVKPLPEMVLDYFLPNDVYGDDPFTPEIEPPIPFPLGVRVKNNGHGTAKNLSIDSAQPKIVDNQQGLLIGFTIAGTEINGQPSPNNSLLVSFGDIQANTSGTARWIMTCTLSGKFIDFNATYSHADELGGQMTSLIDAVNTHFLIHDVLVDLPGRDTIRDFLAEDGDVYKVYESQSVDTEVLDRSGSSSLSFNFQTGTDSIYILSTPAAAGFMYVRLTDPFGGQKVLKEVVRSDGKRIKTDNAWLSKTRYKSDPWQYFFNLFDAATTNSYTVVFTNAAAVTQPPVLQFIPDKTGIEGQQLSFIVQASDPDGTIPALSASPLPALAKFTDQGNGTGVFDWTPAVGQAGRYEITFTASEGALKTTQRVVITIASLGNNPPFAPSLPSPQDGASNIPVNTTLSWAGGDPDPGDTVTYDVYFGASNPPAAKVSGNQAARSYPTPTLTYGTTYYWKIVARDNHAAETAGPVWRFTTILASNNVISTVSVNQPAYNPDETVMITSTLRNRNQSVSIQNLVARVTVLNSQGTVLLTDEKQIQTIAPDQTITTNTTWNTSKNPKGTYTVKLEVLDSTNIVSTATTSFQILGSSQTGMGLIGTLSSQPNRVYQGKDETLSYTLTNNGNEDILNLSVKVLIINSETKETIKTLEGTASVSMGTTANGSFVVSTSDFMPGAFEADLEVSLTQPKTLASASFKVIQAVTLPFSDNFDSYTASASPPAPWFSFGDAAAIVTDTEFHSVQNAGAIGGGPDNRQSAFVGLGESYPDRIAYEVWIKVNSTGSSAYVGFSEEILNTLPQFNAVYFNGTDGKVYFMSADRDHGFVVPLLDSFTTGLWRKVHVEIDFANLLGDVYIDDVLVGKDLSVSPKDTTWEQNGTYSFQLNKIGVTHDLGAPFYFDDFSIFSSSAEHTIRTTAGSGGIITPSSSVTVNHGDSQAFTISPDAGYHILDIKVDGISVGAVATYTFVDVASNHTIDASFAINQYSITATAGSNGTVTPLGSVTVDYNGSQTFTITPDTGCHILDVKVDGVSVAAVPSYAFSNVTANHTIEATFAINRYTITATAGPNGTIAPSGQTTVGYNGSLTFAIAPNEGYHVADVKVDGISIGVVTAYTMSNIVANHTIEASFAINQYTVTAAAGPNGTIAPSGPITVDHGRSLTFTITPNAGYRISDVKVDGGSISPVATYTFTNVTAVHTIEASFAVSQHAITATAGPNGAIIPSGTVTVDHGGSLTFTITPNSGYRIWDVDVDGGTLGVAMSYTFTNVASDHSISATFKGFQAISLPFFDNFDDDPVGTCPDSPWDNFNGGPAVVVGSGSHSSANSISISSGPGGGGSAFVNLGETYPDRIAYEVWTKVSSMGSSAYIGFAEEILNLVPQFNAVYFNGTDGKVYFTSADRDHGFMVLLLNSFTINTWHKVRVETDFANLTADVFIDDALVGSGLPVSPRDATWEYGGTHSFQLNKIGMIHQSGSSLYFDDFAASEWNPNTPVNLLRSAGPGQWAVLGMGGIGSASSTSVAMSGSSSVKGSVANMGVANAGSVNMSGSSLINGILSLNTAGRLNKSGTSRVAGGVQQNSATDSVLDQAVEDALAASQSTAALPTTITSPANIAISNPSHNMTITGGTGTNVLHMTNLSISNGTVTLNAPHGGSFIMNVSGSFDLSGASKIVLAGGITASDVLYNFVGSGGSVAMSGGASVAGILLAPQRGISISNAIVTGEIISGGSGISFSGTTQVNNPGP